MTIKAQKKDFLKRNHGLRAEFYVVCPQTRDNCNKCPFFVKDSERFCTVNDDENRGIMIEAWMERQRYIKLPEIPDEIFVNIDTHPEIVDLTLKANNPIDPINPNHYRHGEMQTIERIMMLLGPVKVKAFCEANAVKYLDRSGYKGDALIDRQKADWYLRLARGLDDAVSVSAGMTLLKMFLKKEEEKNGRDSNRNASGNH